ncbi:MAG: hypothetical protein FWE35_26250 [Streptosporangiales bacterium]|nr:hypothetical protein [Streptosporangiales bacterium]
MRLTDRLSLPQRIVVVAALGLAFAAIGASLPDLATPAHFGWYAYAPLQTTFQSGSPVRLGLSGWPGLLIWLFLIIVWALLSVRILRPAPKARSIAPEPTENS